MRAIFISYRREDAEGQAGRLFDDLSQQFGDDSVFMDVAAIEPGRDFRKVIDQHVASCGVLLALIGRSWLTAKDESGRRRLDDPADFVRLETASALKRDIPVVPVLVQGAKMPRAEDLPEDLKELAFRNGVELTHARWDSDLQVLAKALRPHVQGSAPAPAAPPPPAPATASGARSSRLLLGGVAALVVAGAGAFVWHQQDQRAAAEAQRQEAVQREEAARAETERLEQEKLAAEEAARREQAAAEDARRQQDLAQREAQEKQAREQAEREQAVREAREREAREREAKVAAAREAAQGGTTPDPARRVRWKNGHFPPPNGGSVLFTITPSGDPACASYDGGACLWNMTYAQIDFSKVQPLVCGEAHKARWGATGYENPKHWCSLARKWNSP